MVACECSDVHKRRRVVLTGGPGAGKTALLELIRQSFCAHVKVSPEAQGGVTRCVPHLIPNRADPHQRWPGRVKQRQGAHGRPRAATRQPL